ncbi:hypothetical protein JXQ70_08325 [bacterium]|nr:hypothetical protein [bacterium]
MKTRLMVMTVSFLVLCLTCGCSLNRIVVRSTASVLEKGLAAMYRETDLIIAENSLVSQLKLLEALLENDPHNETVLMLLTQGYYAYALGFVEDNDPDRAKMLYVRGRDYARTVLEKADPLWGQGTSDSQHFERALSQIGEKYLEALFWNAMNWGNWIMLSLDNPQALFDLIRVEQMMQLVLERKENLFFAGPHVFFGCLHAARPVMLGGDPQLAQEHFEWAKRLNNDTIKLVDFYKARFYARQVLDAELYEQILSEIVAYDVNSVPEVALLNQIARKKAQFWLDRKDDLF